MATPAGVLWPSFSPEDPTRIRKWLYGTVLVRDWDAAGSTNLNNVQFFAANGNLNPLLLTPVAQGGYGFYDVGNITEDGVSIEPVFNVDETYVWQSRKSQRTDKTKDDEQIMFMAADSTPLVDYLFYDLPIGFTGVPTFPGLGSQGYTVTSPVFSDVVYRQIVLIGVDGSVGANGQCEYIIELRPRVTLAKKAKRTWGSKKIDVREFTYTCHVDPASGYDRQTLRGGVVWIAEGGAVVFASPNYVSKNYPVANTATIVPSTLAAAAPTGTGGTWTAGPEYWVITATTANGESTKSNEVTQTIVTTTNSVVLTWSVVTGATGYKVYRGTTPGGENALITTIGSGATVTYTDTGSAGSAATPPVVNNASIPAPTGLGVTPSSTGGVLPAATDFWVITALTATGETTKSNEVTATLTGTTSSAALSWTADSGATGYNVYRGSVAAGENVLAGYIPSGATTSYTDIGASVVATPLTSHQVLLQWQEPLTSNAPFTYTITQTTGGSTTATTIVSAPTVVSGTTTVQATVGSLTATNVYTFTVTVTASDGASAVYPVSNSITST